MYLSEEEVGNGEGGEDACQVGKEAAGDGMACVANADRAEIDGKDVERGVGGALEDAGEATNEGVGSVSGHRINHHATRSRT